MPKVPRLRSPYDLVGGLVHFGRMIDKIRLRAADRLPADYHRSLGIGHDRLLCSFLQISYERLREHVLENKHSSDEQILEWAYCHGRRLTPIDHVVFNGFLSKRGWRDEAAPRLPQWLASSGLPPDAAQTNFDYIELDENRPARHQSVFERNGGEP